MKEKLAVALSSVIICFFILFSVLTHESNNDKSTKASEVVEKENEKSEEDDEQIIEEDSSKEEFTDGEVEEKISHNVYVEVKGAVNKPGVYEVEEGIRIFELFNIAGGLKKDANIEYINQTVKVKDEMLLVVFTNAEINELEKQKEIEALEESEIITDAKKQGDIIGANVCIEETEEKNTELLSINNATTEQLSTLPGIGEVKAKAIIDYRNKNGEFKTIEELMNVSGIGQSTFDKIKALITI